MATVVKVRVQSLGLDRATNTPVVILQEEEGDRILPIWIGPSEASAIAMQLAAWSFSRPLTHDLLVSVVGGLGGTLDRVIITKVEGNTYYAELVLRRGEEIIAVDARPSDSIAVALRMNAPIFAESSLLERVSVEIAEHESPDLPAGPPPPAPRPEAAQENLQDYLKRLTPEDFGRFNP